MSTSAEVQKKHARETRSSEVSGVVSPMFEASQIWQACEKYDASVIAVLCFPSSFTPSLFFLFESLRAIAFTNLSDYEKAYNADKLSYRCIIFMYMFDPLGPRKLGIF